MDVTLEDIESITIAVWATMIDTELTVDPAAKLGSIEASHVGVVALTGAYEGEVAVHLSESLVRGAASVMFDVPARDVTEDQKRDAVAELTNMVGGNIKCLVEQPTQLGLPEVHGRSEHPAENATSREPTVLGFAGVDGRLVVSVRKSIARG